jgi:hypothetical protein
MFYAVRKKKVGNSPLITYIRRIIPKYVTDRGASKKES